MKEFFKYTLATITGIVLFLVITGIFGVISIVGMISTSEATQTVKDNSVFVLKLSGVLEERADNNLMSQISDDISTIGLDDILNAIEKASLELIILNQKMKIYHLIPYQINQKLRLLKKKLRTI